MEIKTIHYKRINNLGNYSSEHLEMYAEISSEEDAVQCGKRLKEAVEAVLGLSSSYPDEEEGEFTSAIDREISKSNAQIDF